MAMPFLKGGDYVTIEKLENNKNVRRRTSWKLHLYHFLNFPKAIDSGIQPYLNEWKLNGRMGQK
jgi:hypothetical protein